MRNYTCPENPIKPKFDRYQTINHHNAPSSSNFYNGRSIPPPQPYFVPGYTGWTPGCGPKRHFILGETYGHFTHELLHSHPVGGGRMNPLFDDLRFVNSFKAPPLHTTSENPNKPLDPYFLPGYTGSIPGSGNKRFESIGETYGRMSHIRLAKHRVGGNRLRPILKEPSEYVAEREETKFYCNKHEVTANDLKRRSGMVPGYTGHIPRALFRFGKTAAKISTECIAEFEQLMDRKKGREQYQVFNRI